MRKATTFIRLLGEGNLPAPAPISNLGWRQIAVSDNGKYYVSGRVDVVSNLYVSNTYGLTWAAKASPQSWSIRGASISSTGQYMIMLSANFLFKSNDFGATWSAPAQVQQWIHSSMNPSGQYQLAVGSDTGFTDGIYVSSNYGATWTMKTILSGFATKVSETGQYQSVSTGPSTAGFIYTSSDYGVTWNQRATSKNWRGMAMSSDGQYQLSAVYSGFIFVSSDYGLTWNQRGTSSTWNNTAMSTSGQYQITTGTGNVSVSSDYGASWTVKTPGAAGMISGVAMSSTGQYITISSSSASQYIYVSSDYGATWSQKAIQQQWGEVAMTPSGKYHAVALYNPPGYIYGSSDFGVTWGAISRPI